MTDNNFETTLEETATSIETAQAEPITESTEFIVEKPQTEIESAQVLGWTNISNPDVLKYPATFKEGKKELSGQFTPRTKDGRIVGYSLVDENGKELKNLAPKQFSEILAGKRKGTEVRFEVSTDDYMKIQNRLENELYFNDIPQAARDEKSFKEQMETLQTGQIVRLISQEADRTTETEYKFHKIGTKSIDRGKIIAEPFIKTASAGRKSSEKTLEYENRSRKSGYAALGWTELFAKIQAGARMQFSQPIKEFYQEEDKRIIAESKPKTAPTQPEKPQAQEEKPVERPKKETPKPVRPVSEWERIDNAMGVIQGKFDDFRQAIRDGNLVEVFNKYGSVGTYGLSSRYLRTFSGQFEYGEYRIDDEYKGQFDISRLKTNTDEQGIMRYRIVGSAISPLFNLRSNELISTEETEKIEQKIIETPQEKPIVQTQPAVERKIPRIPVELAKRIMAGLRKLKQPEQPKDPVEAEKNL